MPVQWRYVALCIGLASCSLYNDSDFPHAAVQITPPPQYRVWWDVVETCSKYVLPFEAVTWFTVPRGSLSLNGESAAGVWFSDGNRIVIGEGWRDNPALVRHEILHALLGTSSHPRDFFLSSCAGLVICSGECAERSVLPDAIELSPEMLQVSVVAFPRMPSVTLHDGWATIVVEVRNPLSDNAFVAHERFTSSTCPFGYFIRSALHPERHDAGCASLDYEVSDSRVYSGRGRLDVSYSRLTFTLRTTGEPLRTK